MQPPGAARFCLEPNLRRYFPPNLYALSTTVAI
jgi:hypothetical protein